MAKPSQGFYLIFFSTASLLLCKKKPLQGRQEIDNAGAHVFTQQLVCNIPPEKLLRVGHFSEDSDSEWWVSSWLRQLEESWHLARGENEHIFLPCVILADLGLGANWADLRIDEPEKQPPSQGRLWARFSCGLWKYRLPHILTNILRGGVIAEICGTAKKIKQNKTFLTYQEDLSSPSLQSPCSVFLPLPFHSLGRLVPSNKLSTTVAKSMH